MSFQQPSLSAIPRPQTSLVGREPETHAIAELMCRPSVQLITLTGAGGAGKTRLAQHVALTTRGFPDGRWFIELAVISDPALVLPEIAHTLGLREHGATSPADQIVSALSGRQTLLVLDNFEHLLEAALPVSRLLARLEGLTLLVTSREALNLAPEHVIPIGALDITTSDGAGHSQAAELFLQRSRAIRPRYDPSPDDLLAIEDICTQLSGSPLAIELAAARTRIMSPQALRTRLSSPLHLLSDGPSDAPDRHRSMRDAIDWSYQLLDEPQRSLLREIGVFAGSAPLDGLEFVVADGGMWPVDETIDLLVRLANANMIETQERETKARFSVYPTVREFLRDELERMDELGAARDRHATWVEHLSRALLLEFSGPLENRAMARTRAELDNIRAALGWLIEKGDLARAARMIGNLGDFWSFGGQTNEGKRWLERIGPRLNETTLSPQEAHRFWAAAGLISWSQGNTELAGDYYERSWTVASKAGDRAAQAVSRMWQAQFAWYAGDYARQYAFASESLALSAEQSLSWAGAQTLLAIAEMRLDRLDAAEAALETARERHAAIGFTRASIWTVQLMGDLALLRGDVSAAAGRYRESLLLALPFSSAWGIFEALSGLIRAALERGWTAEALELFASAELLIVTESVVPREGSWLTAADQEQLKTRLTPDDMQQLSQHAAARSLTQLVGRATEIARAIEHGEPNIARRSPATKREARQRRPFELSPREHAVLELLVQGKTDRQISTELGMSYGTARSHVAHVLQKLDARNRAAAVRKALELERA